MDETTQKTLAQLELSIIQLQNALTEISATAVEQARLRVANNERLLVLNAAILALTFTAATSSSFAQILLTRSALDTIGVLLFTSWRALILAVVLSLASNWFSVTSTAHHMTSYHLTKLKSIAAYMGRAVEHAQPGSGALFFPDAGGASEAAETSARHSKNFEAVAQVCSVFAPTYTVVALLTCTALQSWLLDTRTDQMHLTTLFMYTPHSMKVFRTLATLHLVPMFCCCC